jgi:hypothetical protein
MTVEQGMSAPVVGLQALQFGRGMVTDARIS